MSAATFSNTCQTHVEDMQLDNDSIHVMLRDVFPLHTQSVDEIGDTEHVIEPSNEGPSGQQRTQVPNKNAQKFYDLLKDAEQPFYEGFEVFRVLSYLTPLQDQTNIMAGGDIAEEVIQ
ncbi:hypothetical protein RHMOL_Rhmol01G0302300 [Rhododendron molle]|uniref:Uncharacterized protein n=1 Tax=Rhododendron molle TaxID=49168 RepID=A0ACC0Q7G2_RHOML|nr:hypothetical protein RHMOL_Rhmol01G0302300 [Rhododendron molle]